MIQVFRYLILFLILGLLIGCAAQQQQYTYEQPLHDLGVLEPDSVSIADITEISHDEIANIQPGQRPPLDSDEAGIWMVMDNAEEDLKNSGYLYRDARLHAYLQEIVARLTPEYADDIRIYLVRIPDFNASMAPNGAMQVWTGLFLRVENEAQLASIIGHEIGHYLRRHSLQRLRQIVSATNSTIFLNIAAAMFGVPEAGQLIQLATLGTLQAYSREQEREADGYGLALMSRAGYDPRETAAVWSRLIEENEADDDKRTPPIFLSTHPSSSERNAALNRLADKIVAGRDGDFEINSERFLAHILPHRKEFFRDELHLRNFDRTEHAFNVLLEQGANPAEVVYFQGELYRLRAAEGDHERALDAYQQALTADGKPPLEIHKAMGQLFRRTGRKQEAVRAYQKYLTAVPDTYDKEMILYTIKRLQNENQ